MVIAVAFFAYFGRMLTKTEMALFAFHATIVSWMTILSSLGLTTLAIRDIAELVARDKIIESRRLVSSVMWYRSLAALCAVVVLLLLAPYLSMWVFGTDIHAMTFRCIVVSAFFETEARALALIQVSLQRFHTRAVCLVFQNLANRILAVVGYFAFGINGFILGFALGSLATSAMHVWTLRYEATRHVIPFGDIWKKSRVYYSTEVLRSLQMNVDQPLVAFLLGETALANFFMAKRFYQICTTAIYAVVAPAGTKLSEIRPEGPDAVRVYFRKTLYMVAFLFVPVGAVLVGASSLLMRVLAGEKYADASVILACFGLAVAIQCTNPMWREAVYRLLAPRYLVMHTVLLTVGTFGLYALLLPLLGPVGIPLAYAGAAALTIGWSISVLRRHAQLGVEAGIYLRVIGSGLFVLAAVYVAQAWLSFPGVVVLVVVAAGIAFLTGTFVFAPPDVRTMILGVLRRGRSRSGARTASCSECTKGN